MTDIAPEQIRKRREDLPEVLKNALFSAGNADQIWQISENFNINDVNKIALIGKITSWVIMGFIKIEDYAKTIQENLNLDFNTASLIAKELESKIFSPIKTELSKLTIYRLNSLNEELRYRVASTTIKSPQSVTIPPQINRVEITPAPASIPPQKPAPAPPSISQSANTQIQNTPVMLYQKQEQKPVAESIKSRIVGEIEISAGGKPTASSVPARIEIGPEFPKLVHYSDFKTPVNNQGQASLPPTPTPIKPGTVPAASEEVLDLSAFKPQEKQNSQVQPQTAGQPTIEGNTLDLR